MRAYKTNNVLILWGDDFGHLDASLTYEALDTCIKAIEDHLESIGQPDKYRLSYSTIDSYLTDVFEYSKQNKIQFTQQKGDLWEYNHDG